MSEPHHERTIGLVGATRAGVGAIVGGGILVLAGVAFEHTGPGAVLAFGLNGVIAVLTALSFAEMSTAFPESGGTYTFAKKVLSVRAAFAVGWVLWFAYIVAGVLYALGFAEYAVALVGASLKTAGLAPPTWLSARGTVLCLSVGAVSLYTLSLVRKAAGGGTLSTWGKVIVLLIIVLVGIFATSQSPERVEAGMRPLLPHGVLGLVQAMGFTFIALQGFDLVAAIAGEVREPTRTIPRAMLLSLGLALVIYIPLLIVVAAVGTPEGTTIAALSARDPETVMARAAGHFMGETGYWLVMVAAVLATLSALHANIFAASRVAFSMARDRTLPGALARRHAVRLTPIMAVTTSALTMAAILLMVPNLAAAGAAASLIFLISFAFAHGTSILARRRADESGTPFRAPFFPAVPVVGGAACMALAIFQGVAVPAAGAIALVWLGLGAILYYTQFAGRAEKLDALAEARDPALIRMRGRSPLVLVPVANPATAPALVDVAAALAPPAVGRVLLLTVMRPPEEGADPAGPIHATQEVLAFAVAASLAGGHRPEALLTVAGSPWPEIRRVADTHRCEALLLGLSGWDELEGGELEGLLNAVSSDVAVLRAPRGWRLEQAERILVPVGGRGGHDDLRARLLGSLWRGRRRDVTFLAVAPGTATNEDCAHIQRKLEALAEDESPGKPATLVVRGDDVVEAVTARATECDLLILGLENRGGRKRFGHVALDIARATGTATLMISRRG